MRGWNGRYVGVDVSRKVIEDVAATCNDINAEWHISAIENFPTFGTLFDTICFCESICYVKVGSVSSLLGRCRESLVSGGRIVVRICDANRHREYVSLLNELGFKAAPPIYVLDT